MSLNRFLLSLTISKEKRDKMARFVTIWFRSLKTDWFTIRQPELRNIPFVLSTPDHGRMIITAANESAHVQGVETGMVVADARAIIPSLKVMDDDPGLTFRLLKVIAEWCIRYTNIVAVDLPDGIIMNSTGCAHLWGGELSYLKDINTRLKNRGYNIRATMADTIGTAWAMAHYGDKNPIAETGKQMEVLLSLPPSALRLETTVVERLHKLGLHQVKNFIDIPYSVLRRRFGNEFILKLNQAIGNEDEPIIPVIPIEPWRERLPCLEPIVTAVGIEIALHRLLETICCKLQKEGLGIRKAVFKGFRIDGKSVQIEIGTHRATQNVVHLYKLFESKISSIEPASGIELFMMEALMTEKVSPVQEKLWDTTTGLDDPGLPELLDKLSNRFGISPIHRFLPAEHYLPEKSFKESVSLNEPVTTTWKIERPRPVHLLNPPVRIEVTAPIPDYPPMNFRWKGKLYKIKKSDGPERIEQEWWIQDGPHRDYYCVEDDEGRRYWIFRSGHYILNPIPEWYLHGFFA
jgi:protein ImuB